MGRFTGKVTVVTEAGGGIGRAAAARLAAEGASLVLVDRVLPMYPACTLTLPNPCWCRRARIGR
jgi:NADP-dependent 3-hydroxy acid dehydrogenase YdfG